MAHFTYLWTNECRLNSIAAGWEGKPLDISAGSAFTKRNVKKDDRELHWEAVAEITKLLT